MNFSRQRRRRFFGARRSNLSKNRRACSRRTAPNVRSAREIERVHPSGRVPPIRRPLPMSDATGDRPEQRVRQDHARCQFRIPPVRRPGVELAAQVLPLELDLAPGQRDPSDSAIGRDPAGVEPVTASLSHRFVPAYVKDNPSSDPLCEAVFRRVQQNVPSLEGGNAHEMPDHRPNTLTA